jgi:hypothetical protein
LRGVDAQLIDQVAADGGGARLAECDVAVAPALGIGMAHEDDAAGGVFGEEGGERDKRGVIGAREFRCAGAEAQVVERHCPELGKARDGLRRRHTFGRGSADGRGRFQRRAARRGDPCRVRCGIADMHDMDIDRLAAERDGDGDGLSLLFSGRGEIAEIADVDMHLGALTHVELPAEIEAAAGPVGAGQVDHVALIAELPFDPGDHRVDGEIAFDRDLPCGGADRAGDRPERHAAAVPGAGGDHVWVAGPGGVAATIVAPSGRARSSAGRGP